jgi:SMC interacting uncharacterized protein involved in chromosome segregation
VLAEKMTSNEDLSSVQEKFSLEKQHYEQLLKARDKEIESLKQDNEGLRRELQNSYLSHEQRVFK